MDTKTEDSKIFLLGLTGYYVTGYTSSYNGVICNYLFSDTLSTWQIFSTVSRSTKGNLMLSNTEFFFTFSSTSISSPVGFYKYTFGNANLDWKNIMICTTGTWGSGYSESQISGTTIYNFFIADQNYYLYMASFNVSTGSLIGSRYKSSITLGNVYGSALMGNYLLATITTNIPSQYYVLMYNIVTDIFTIRKSNFILLYQWGAEPSTER